MRGGFCRNDEWRFICGKKGICGLHRLFAAKKASSYLSMKGTYSTSSFGNTGLDNWDERQGNYQVTEPISKID